MKKKAPSFDDALAVVVGDAPPSPRVLRGLNNLDEPQLVALLAIWPRLSDDRRAALVERLRQMAEEDVELDFTPIFRFALSDIDERVRLASVDGLREDESLGIIDPLVVLLRSDPSQAVRAASAISLGRFMVLGELERINRRRRDQVYSALMGALLTSPPDSLVHRHALESLSYVSNEEIETHIREAYGSSDPGLRISAVVAMGRSADHIYSAIVLSELSSQIPAMRREAARAAGQLELLEAIPALGELLEDPNQDVCIAAIEALGQMSGEEARRLLDSMVLSEDEEIVEAAEDALAEYEFMHGNLDVPTGWLDEINSPGGLADGAERSSGQADPGNQSGQTRQRSE